MIIETNVPVKRTLVNEDFFDSPDLSYAEEVVLSLIRSKGSLSKVNLVEKTDFSRTKVTTCLNALIRKKYLIEYGDGDYTGGRRSALFGINGNKGLMLGADVGATSVDLIIATFSGEPLVRYNEPALVSDGPKIILDRIVNQFEKLLEENHLDDKEIIGLGVGVPGPVNFKLGTVVSPPIMPGWNNFPIIGYLHKRFPDTVIAVDNDVNIMARGELVNGVGIGKKNLIFVKIGTGIGAGIICEGRVYRGSDGCAGDIGHIFADKSGPICSCGNTGCLEAIAGGKAMADLAVEAVKEGKSNILAKIYESKDGVLSTEDIATAANNGDIFSLELIRDSGRLIGDVLSGLVNFSNPEMIVIGGGVSHVGNLLLSSIRQSILKRSLPLATKNLSIVFSSIPEDAGVFGAVNLAMDIALSSPDNRKEKKLFAQIN